MCHLLYNQKNVRRMKKKQIEIMHDGERLFADLDEIIYIKVVKKTSTFVLKNSTFEIEASLASIMEKIDEVGKIYEHSLMQVGRNYIINTDLILHTDVVNGTIKLSKGIIPAVTQDEPVKKPVKKYDGPWMQTVEAIKKIREEKARQGLLEVQDEREEQDVPKDYYTIDVHVASIKKLLENLKSAGKLKTLVDLAPSKGLNGSLDTLNEFRLNDMGHEYVDLGLPSRTLWAAANLGEYDKKHSYYAWGELYEKDIYDWAHYKAYPQKGLVKGLDLAHDVAHKSWGGNWRLPTLNEFLELFHECKVNWCSKPYGCLVTGPNGNKIFLSAYGNRKGAYLNDFNHQGNYWVSTGNKDRLSLAMLFHERLGHEGNFMYKFRRTERCFGYSIRPVMSALSNDKPEKRTVLIIRSFNFFHDEPYEMLPWNPEGWNVVMPWFLDEPYKVLDYLKEVCKEINPDVIVGVSSGSFFCKQLEGYPRICLDPEDLPSKTLEERMREIKTGGVTSELIDKYREAEKMMKMARGKEKCCAVFSKSMAKDEFYSWDIIEFPQLENPENWMNSFLYPLMEEII